LQGITIENHLQEPKRARGSVLTCGPMPRPRASPFASSQRLRRALGAAAVLVATNAPARADRGASQQAEALFVLWIPAGTFTLSPLASPLPNYNHQRVAGLRRPLRRQLEARQRLDRAPDGRCLARDGVGLRAASRQAVDEAGAPDPRRADPRHVRRRRQRGRRHEQNDD
jgi:hypothetical protein